MRVYPIQPQCSLRRFQRGLSVICMVLMLAGGAPARSRSDVLGKDTDKFITNEFFEAYCLTGLLLPLTEKGPQGKKRVFRTLEASGIAFSLTEGLKALTHESRPDRTGHDAFPSSHASLSFTIATMESAYHPKSAWLWYGGATLISAARVDEGKHYAQDAIVGALLGYGVARWELSQKRGIILQPLISSRETGLMVAARF